MSKPKYATCSQLGETLGRSLDSLNRFILRERYEPADLYAEALRLVNPVGGILSVEMLNEVLAWGLQPAYVTADSWYACVSNLKTVKDHSIAWLMAV